jgi:hypothetical protein
MWHLQWLSHKIQSLAKPPIQISDWIEANQFGRLDRSGHNPLELFNRVFANVNAENTFHH